MLFGIRFLINGTRLREFLEKAKEETTDEAIKKDIINSLETTLVSYALLKTLVKDTQKLVELIEGLKITGLPPPRTEEPEAVKQARLNFNEAAYLKMVGKDLRNTLWEDQESWKEVRRVLRTALNSLFSIIGAGIAAFLLTSWSTGISREFSIAVGIGVGLLILIAEVFMVARRHRL